MKIFEFVSGLFSKGVEAFGGNWMYGIVLAVGITAGGAAMLSYNKAQIESLSKEVAVVEGQRDAYKDAAETNLQAVKDFAIHSQQLINSIDKLHEDSLKRQKEFDDIRGYISAAPASDDVPTPKIVIDTISALYREDHK